MKRPWTRPGSNSTCPNMRVSLAFVALFASSCLAASFKDFEQITDAPFLPKVDPTVARNLLRIAMTELPSRSESVSVIDLLSRVAVLLKSNKVEITKGNESTIFAAISIVTKDLMAEKGKLFEMILDPKHQGTAQEFIDILSSLSNTFSRLVEIQESLKNAHLGGVLLAAQNIVEEIINTKEKYMNRFSKKDSSIKGKIEKALKQCQNSLDPKLKGKVVAESEDFIEDDEFFGEDDGDFGSEGEPEFGSEGEPEFDDEDPVEYEDTFDPKSEIPLKLDHLKSVIKEFSSAMNNEDTKTLYSNYKVGYDLLCHHIEGQAGRNKECAEMRDQIKSKLERKITSQINSVEKKLSAVLNNFDAIFSVSQQILQWNAIDDVNIAIKALANLTKMKEMFGDDFIASEGLNDEIRGLMSKFYSQFEGMAERISDVMTSTVKLFQEQVGDEILILKGLLAAYLPEVDLEILNYLTPIPVDDQEDDLDILSTPISDFFCGYVYAEMFPSLMKLSQLREMRAHIREQKRDFNAKLQLIKERNVAHSNVIGWVGVRLFNLELIDYEESCYYHNTFLMLETLLNDWITQAAKGRDQALQMTDETKIVLSENLNLYSNAYNNYGIYLFPLESKLQRLTEGEINFLDRDDYEKVVMSVVDAMKKGKIPKEEIPEQVIKKLYHQGLKYICIDLNETIKKEQKKRNPN